MSTQSTDRIAILANGAEVPLERAAAILGRLGSHLHHSDSEWEVVYHLRELCLGREIEPEQERTLRQELWLSANGELDPDVRAVVLAAVRGEGRVLHLSSPFTDENDRAIAEFISARDHIRCCLSDDEAQRLLDEDPFPKAIREELLRRHRSAPEAPTPDIKSFVEKIMKRHDAENPGSPPPPSQ